ncbi:MAG: ABC transporter permease [Bacteroidetes bacterium]|nr:ABC transporter permease [Bacteroidota bacterium]
MFFKKKQYESSASLSILAWRKFRKNRLGFGSLLFIGMAVMIALLGYLISPDNTPFANEQYLELGLRKPGTTITFLPVLKNEEPLQHNFIYVMLFGQKSRFTSLPVSSWRRDGNHIIITEYTDSPTLHPAEKTFSSGEAGAPYTRTFWLGTDRFGRDYLSMLIIGTRVSLAVGFISVFISLLIGITIGALGGFFRGWIDQVVVWIINVVWSIPTLLLVIAITFALGKGFWQVFVAVGLTMWVEVARVVRGQILSIREKEFVEAGRALGFSNFRIIFHHILPNIMGVVIVISAANFASAILLEAGLSFLGIGVQPPMPSWGSMIKENYGYIILDSAQLAILPGLAIMLMVLAFMLVGNALRDALDVKTSTVN